MAALGKGVVEIIPRMIGETKKRAGLPARFSECAAQ
jgi:hypothetical protein